MNDPWSTPTIERPTWMTDDIQKALEFYSYPLTTDGMLMLWQKSKDLLSHWKETEMEYRKVCTSFLTPDKPEGTTNVELGNGYVAKVVNKYNYKPKDDNDTIWAGLEKIEKLGNEGPFVAKRLFSWTPSFLKKEYVQLQEDAAKGSQFAKDVLKIIENELIVITEAAPTLTIVEPKEEKRK